MANRAWTKATLLGRLAETLEDVTDGKVTAKDVLTHPEETILRDMSGDQVVALVREAIINEQLSRYTH
ncbi:MAG: hypothetical protein EP299_01745 [Acidobacteria bacterium]|nr:MAG: hypothetical protein EP299_01745 [Acidobacteriota bacterium]